MANINRMNMAETDHIKEEVYIYWLNKFQYNVESYKTIVVLSKLGKDCFRINIKDKYLQ